MIHQVAFVTVFIVLFFNVHGFHSMKPADSKITSLQFPTIISMTAEGLPGQLPPMGYFDPFALAENKSDLQVKKVSDQQ